MENARVVIVISNTHKSFEHPGNYIITYVTITGCRTKLL